MRILRAADHRRMPWKNGGGETIEIAIHPEGAGLDAFDWRISMASVAADGPFSAFPDIDRTLAVLEGEGIFLAVDEQETKLTQASAPFSFPGDVPTSGRLLRGPIRDLNIMTRRWRWQHGVTRHHTSGHLPPCGPDDLAILLCGAGDIEISAGAETASLHRYDAALLPASKADTSIRMMDGASVLFRIVLAPLA